MAQKIRMRSFTDETRAREWMRLLNQSRRGRTELVVMVEGPDDGGFTIMELREAIELGFGYEWEV